MVYVATAITLAAMAGLVLWLLFVWFGSVWYRFWRYHRRKGIPLPDGPGWSDRIGHWMREAWALVLIHVWRMERGPRQLGADAPGNPVLCVHGFTQDRTNFSALRRRLWELGRPSIAVDLGIPGQHPERLAWVVYRELERMVEAHPGKPIDIVCHSMGGLVLREALKQRPDLCAHIGTIVTLGSPHHGTAAARWPVRIWPEGGGLARGSDWLAELPSFAESAPNARSVTIGGSADYIVYPLSTCHLEGSEAVNFHGLGHVGLLWDSDVLDTVIAAFDGASLPSAEEHLVGVRLEAHQHHAVADQ